MGSEIDVEYEKKHTALYFRDRRYIWYKVHDSSLLLVSQFSRSR